MQFENLFNLINEVPHIVLPDEAEIDVDLSRVIAIDYCVEKWLISNELKMSIAQALYQLTGSGIVPVRKGNEVYIKDFNKNTEIPLIEHQEAVDILESYDIDISKLLIDFINNEKYFRYCTEDKCFVRKPRPGKGFIEFEG